MPRKRKNLTTDDQIVAAYKLHRSGPKVAKLLGLGPTTVHRVLLQNNVPRVGLTEYRKSMGVAKIKPYNGVYVGPTAQILEWYVSGLSLKAIADRIERSTHVVHRIVKMAGISRSWGAGGPQHSMWKGGRLDAGQGYWRVWVSEDDPMASMRTHQGYVLEHRLIMARKLGRPLLSSETVHHIDGDRANNVPENLEIRQGKHGKHIVMCCMDCGSRNVGPVGIS